MTNVKADAQTSLPTGSKGADERGDNKITGGINMTLKKSTARRVALFTSSSFIAASLSALVFAGISAAPTMAHAFDECTPSGATLTDGPDGTSDPTLNGAASDTFSCAGATSFATSGITYSSQGNLTVTAVGAMDVGTVGINITGNGGDDIRFTGQNQSILIPSVITGSSGPVIDMRSASGNITAATSGVNATAAGATHAVFLQSTGAGNITYTKSGSSLTTAVLADGPDGQAAVSAQTNGGNITLNVSTGSNGGLHGRLRGVFAETTGTGNVVLNLSGNDGGAGGISASATEGIAAIDVITGTGLVDLNINGPVNGGAGYAIRVASAGTVDVDITGRQTTGAVDFSGVTGSGVTFDTSGTTASWQATGASVFTAMADVVTIAASAPVGFAPVDSLFDGATLDFGAGADLLRVNSRLTAQDATVRNLETLTNTGMLTSRSLSLVGLGAFNNSGTISLLPTETYTSYLSIPEATFTGTGASQIDVGVAFDGRSQPDCASPVGAIGCINLQGGATAGSTLVVFSDIAPIATSGYVADGLTFIDVSGGTTDPSHFTFDISGLNAIDHPLYGEVIDRAGYFVYMPRFDAETQRYMLISQPRDGQLFEYTMLPGAAQSIWQLTTHTITDRQADLRGKGATGEVWLRAAGEVSQRNFGSAFQGYDATYNFDHAYKLYAGTIIGGMDLIAGESGDYDYVLGVQLGYVSSSFDLETSESSGQFTGATGGVYASVWNSRYFFDSTFNVNALTLDYDAPALSSQTNTWLNSIGAAAEAGARYMLSERFYAEPLVAGSFTQTTFEEISLTSGEVQPEDASSRRAALGLRVGADYAGQSVNWSYFLTGRAWHEFEGESEGVFTNPGDNLPLSADDFSGTFSEFEAGLTMSNDAGTVSGFVTSGVKAQDGYSAVNLSTGIRLRW